MRHLNTNFIFTPFLILLFLLTSLSSCQRILYAVTDKGVKHEKVAINEAEGKEVVMIPMMHVAKPKFFAEVKSYLDQKRAEGYVVFFESIGNIKYEDGKLVWDYRFDSLMLDTLDRKIRKVLGVYPRYTKDNKSLSAAARDKRFVAQTAENTGLDVQKDVWVDLSTSELIRKYEEGYGEIILTDCDFNTPFKAKYKCKSNETHNNFYLTNTIRDAYIIQQVKESEHKKIVLLYGGMHYHMLWGKLTNSSYGHGYTAVEKEKKSKSKK